MSDFIVLVKQVPDVTQITDNAFNPETGTLIRTRLASVINELDTCALAVANKMKKISSSTGRIIVLTMGPPMAAEVLRYSLSRCADSAILLTDRALGGADTWATANPLAYAIRKIVKDMLGGTDDYYVVAGMQSVDGDTAQVPAQLAAELNMPCIAYATDVNYNRGSFEFDRIISGGSQVVASKKAPAVITVAKYDYPLFASFAGTRRAKDFELIQWTAEDVKASGVGVAGSKTRVIRVFPPGKTTRKCKEITDAAELAKIVVDEFAASDELQLSSVSDDENYVLPERRDNKFNRHFEGTEKEIADFKKLAAKLDSMGIKDPSEINDEIKTQIFEDKDTDFHKKSLDDMINGFACNNSMYKGQVWVVAQHDSGKIHPATFELIGKASELATGLETKVGVVIVGADVKKFSKELIAAGADLVYVTENPLLEKFDPASYSKALCHSIGKYWPQIVLFAATPRGRVFAPMVSYKLDCGLTADCTGLEIKDNSRKGQVAILMQTRPALGGNVMATICTKDSKCQMATARPGVMKRLPDVPTRTGRVIEEPVEILASDISLNILSTETGAGEVALDSEVIVSGGKGMQNRDTYEKLVSTLTSSLAKKLNVSVERGASRAAVEQGFVDRIHQVGQTGTSIGPKMYFALGISGAIQHMIGVANSEIIVAINSDPNAPIFKHCDYYMVGTVENLIPQIAKALTQNKYP